MDKQTNRNDGEEGKIMMKVTQEMMRGQLRDHQMMLTQHLRQINKLIEMGQKKGEMTMKFPQELMRWQSKDLETVIQQNV